MIEQLALNSFVLGAIVALMSIGLVLTFSVLGVINYAHGEMYMFGAVIIFFLCSRYAAMDYALACVIAVLAVGLLGWILDKVLIVRFHGNLMAGVIATIGLLMIFQNMMWPIFGPIPKSVPSPLPGVIQILGTSLSIERIIVVGIAVFVILGMAWFIKNTRMGKAIRAVQQDIEAARVQGVNIEHICAVTFGISTGLAALAGALIAPIYIIEPAMGFLALEFAFIVIIFGGMGSIMGAFIASFIIGLQYTFTAAFWGVEWAMAMSFGIAMIVLLVRPRGLMGASGRVEEA